VVPDRRPVPRWRRERPLPLRRHRGIAVETRQPVPNFSVALDERNASAGRRTQWIDLLQRCDERGQVARSLDCVDLIDRHRLALHPGMDIPKPRVLSVRAALRDRNGDLERK